MLPSPLMDAARARAAASLETARVESIAAGGAGVARLEGRAVFIPWTAPGDVVRFRILADKGKYLRGELAEVLEPSPWRREPPCPYWAACGGCPLQQINPEGQAQARRRIFLDALARIGKMDLPVPLQAPGPDSTRFGYRTRVRFQVKGKEIGFFAPGSRRLVPVENCLLAEPAVESALARVRRLLGSASAARGIEAVEITSLGPGPDEGAGIFLHPPGSRDRRADTLSSGTRAEWDTYCREAGHPLAVAGERAPSATPAWTAAYSLPLPGEGGREEILRVSPESFLQPNRAGNRALVEAAVNWARTPEGADPADATPPGGATAVDLYCGAGNFTLPLARLFARVAGVEANPYALYDAEANRRAAGLGNVRFLRREAGRADPGEIIDALEGERPAAVLLDPPRRGALEAIPLVTALASRRILYVSCNPATFARDARALAKAGYRMGSASMIPMFPNTAHTETVTSWFMGSAPIG